MGRAEAHYELQTTESGVESCAVYLGAGKTEDVAVVHTGIHYSDNTVITEP